MLILEEASQWPGELLESIYQLCLKLVEINPVFTFMLVCDPDQLPAVNGSPIHLSTAWAKLRVILLQQNQRQSDESCRIRRLVTLGATGEEVSDEIVDFVAGLVSTSASEAASEGEDVLVAAAVNAVADQHNAACLRRLNPAAPTLYEAKDIVNGVDKSLLGSTGLKETVCLHVQGS